MDDSMFLDQTKRIVRDRIIGGLVVLAVVILAAVLYIWQTHSFIIDENEQYSQTTTDQMARRLNELFQNSETCLEMASSVYENTLTSPEITPASLRNIANDTMFNNVQYISADGRVITENGEVTSGITRAYIDDGLAGHSGMASVIGSEFYNGDNVLVFYTPLRYDGAVIGVLGGVFTSSNLSEELQATIFGGDATTFLCQRDGAIVASSNNEYLAAKSAFKLSDSEYSGDDTGGQRIGKMRRIFEEGSSGNLSFTTKDGEGCAYATKLQSYDLMLLSAFPVSVTNAILDRNNMLGMELIAGVLGILVVYMAIVFMQGRSQRKALRAENRQISSIVNASTNLFKRFAIFDFDELTYKYYKAEDVNGAIPMEGPYHVFADYWVSTIEDEKEHQMMQEALVIDNLKKNLTEDVPFLRYEFRSYTELGLAWLQISIICMARDGNGVPTQALYAVQNVTEIKQHEERTRVALEEAYRAAEFASKAKSSFLSSMSHDIRTPMNSIMGLTAVASMNVNDPVRVEDCLNKINSANKHLLGLVNEVLDMAKIESGNISLIEERFNLSDIIEDVLTIIRPQALERRQYLKLNLANIVHEDVLSDSMRLKQIFLNILSNAVKFTPEGGRITFSMDELPSGLPDHGCYRFVFEDTGCGISEEFMDNLFEPFAREEDMRISKIEGTGLGLPIVKSIVELMSGTIEVKSVVGEGTVFTVVVYMKTADEDSLDVVPLAGLDVLVVDDDLNDCKGACLMLQDIGMNAEYVTSGDEAIGLVERREREGCPFDAVVTDWKMPGRDGVEVARQIQLNGVRDLPIIVVTSYDWFNIRDEAESAGVRAFVSKPLFKSRLIQALRTVLVGEDPVDDDGGALQGLDLAGKRILLTDDNELAAEVAMELLSITNAEVERACNGKEAYDMMVANEPGYFDLILMDVQMPIMNGHEASRAIRDAAAELARPDLAQIPIIALTADAFSDDVEKAKNVGMNAHMSKPIDLDTLARLLQEWL